MAIKSGAWANIHNKWHVLSILHDEFNSILHQQGTIQGVYISSPPQVCILWWIGVTDSHTITCAFSNFLEKAIKVVQALPPKNNIIWTSAVYGISAVYGQCIKYNSDKWMLW